jgi:DNA primase
VSDVFTSDTVIGELMYRRKYTRDSMYDTLKERKVFRLDDVNDVKLITNVTDEQLHLWGLVNANGTFLLRNRFVVPIRDTSGSVAALVGWYPDARKYITTPTFGFSKDALFFNMDCYKKYKDGGYKVLYLVEGIFDTISVASLGFCVYGNMGLDLSPIKRQILHRFDTVVALHDNDASGWSTSPYLNGVSGKKRSNVWHVDNEFVSVKLPSGIKDIDDFIRDYDCYDDLVACANSSYMKVLTIDK